MFFARVLLETIARLESPAVIGISGFGGAGKSSFAAKLGQEIDAPVVGIDSFIIDRTTTGYTNWGIMDFARLENEVLRPFVSGKGVRYGHFDWAGNRIVDYREPLLTDRLIVEGVGLFRPDLLRHFALLIWVACPLDEAIRRGEQRDQDATGDSQEEMWEGIWKENDKKCYHDYRPEKIAHFIFDNSHPAIFGISHRAASP